METPKVKKPRTPAQLAHTAKLVALNKERAKQKKANVTSTISKPKPKKEKAIFKTPPLVDEEDSEEDFSDEEYSLATALYKETLSDDDEEGYEPELDELPQKTPSPKYRKRGKIIYYK